MLSDQQLHEELEDKDILEEHWLDEENALNELLEVDELELSLEYDPQDFDFEDEELDSLLWLAQLLELLDDLDCSEAEDEEVLDDPELQLLLRLLELQLLLLLLSLFELDDELSLRNDEDNELLEQLFDISLRHEEEQEEHEKCSITE